MLTDGFSSYRQNPTVRQSVDTSGNITTVNTQQAVKVLTHLVPYDIPVVPSEPRENCPPISSLDKTLQETIATLEVLFTDRLAWTRRALRNYLKTNEQRYCLKYAIAYVGYIFRSGPWRDAIVKFGHDPRTSPDYRIYQTVVFRILPREPELARDGGGGRRSVFPRPSESVIEASKDGNSDTHLFTGKYPLPLDGKIWMVCDIVDPIIRKIFFPENPPPDFLRSTCDWVSDGWYGNGTLAKAKTIIRAKIHAMTKQKRDPDDAEFTRILTFPDHAVDDELAAFHLDLETATSREMQLATEVRATIRGAPTWKGGGNGAGMDRNRNQDNHDQHPPLATAVDINQLNADKAAVKRVRWEEEDDAAAARRLMEEEEESEGEEEAIEREEIAAAIAAEAERQPRRNLGGADDDEEMLEDDEEEDEVDNEGWNAEHEDHMEEDDA
jgi:general transcription factor 3C polypeptide 5 (transcription factor C subunit 1)